MTQSPYYITSEYSGHLAVDLDGLFIAAQGSDVGDNFINVGKPGRIYLQNQGPGRIYVGAGQAYDSGWPTTPSNAWSYNNSGLGSSSNRFKMYLMDSGTNQEFVTDYGLWVVGDTNDAEQTGTLPTGATGRAWVTYLALHG